MNHKLPHHDDWAFLAGAQRGEITSVAKKYVPDGKPGDKLRFYNGGICIAIAKIARIERPTALNDRWLVFWEPESFQQLTK